MVQTWALHYLLVMRRRIQIDDKLAELEFQTFNLNLDRWKTIYGADQRFTPEGDPEIQIDNPRELDAWFESLAAERGMTIAEAERYVARTQGVT